MQEMDSWLRDYGDSHRYVRFATVYWSSVIGLILGTVGMLWSLPVPEEFTKISPALNWGNTFLMAAVVYYFIISMALAIGMLPIVFAIAISQIWLLDSALPVQHLSACLFLVSILGLYVGRAKTGGVRAVVQDIQLMMIAPVWLLSRLYRRIGIPF